MLGLLLAAVGIWVSYIPYGVYQESIYSFRTDKGEHFNFTLTLLVCQVVAHTVVALLTTLAMRESLATLPLGPAWFPGATFVGAMFCSNMALEYVSYPTQALAKSSKMIPVMLGGLIMGSEKYTIIQYLQVLLVTIGITVFQWKKSGGSKESDVLGLVLLLVSLLLDGLTGPRQKVITRNTRCTSFQLMLCCNLWALLFVLAGLLSPYGEGLAGVNFILENPALLQHVVLFSLCSAMGSSFVFYTLKKFGCEAGAGWGRMFVRDHAPPCCLKER